MIGVFDTRALGHLDWKLVWSFLVSVKNGAASVRGFVLHVDHEADGSHVDESHGRRFPYFGQIRHRDKILFFQTSVVLEEEDEEEDKNNQLKWVEV